MPELAKSNFLYLNEGSDFLYSALDVDNLTDMTSSGNLDSDPQWTGSSGALMLIGSTSPCRNAGTPAGAPPWDFTGAPRPQGGAPDIGPHEYQP